MRFSLVVRVVSKNGVGSDAARHRFTLRIAGHQSIERKAVKPGWQLPRLVFLIGTERHATVLPIHFG